MADHDLIHGYLADLARRLPTEVVEELADGLNEAVARNLSRGLDPDEAVAAAIQDFGRPREVMAAFARESAGRHTAVVSLATGPVFGGLWGTALIGASAWDWPVPLGLALLFGASLIGVAATFLLVARTRDPSRTRLAGPASVAMLLLDLAVLSTVLTVRPTFTTALALAVAASATRAVLTLRNLPRVLPG